jgi:hypothetical protein
MNRYADRYGPNDGDGSDHECKAGTGGTSDEGKLARTNTKANDTANAKAQMSSNGKAAGAGGGAIVAMRNHHEILSDLLLCAVELDELQKREVLTWLDTSADIGVNEGISVRVGLGSGLGVNKEAKSVWCGGESKSSSTIDDEAINKGEGEGEDEGVDTDIVAQAFLTLAAELFDASLSPAITADNKHKPSDSAALLQLLRDDCDAMVIESAADPNQLLRK